MIREIQDCNPKIGFHLEDRKAIIALWKYQCWEKGMSLREFDQTKISDIREVMAVKNAVELKTMREAEARAMMDKMRTRW